MRQASQPNERRLRINNDRGWDSRKIRRQASLGLEPLAERRRPDKIDEARDDAAGDEYAAQCTERQRGIAGYAAKEGTECLQCGAAGCAISCQRVCDNVRTTPGRDLLLIDDSNGLIE